MKLRRLFALPVALGVVASAAHGGTDDIARTIADIDTRYQAAVERNDWQAMDRILHPEFALVLGDGKKFNRRDLLDSAREQEFTFEKQVEIPGTQQVRVYGPHTATITALLWLKGTRKKDQAAFDYKLWFTDTYVLTNDGWRYAFGQASLRLPAE